jgi:hypothetical protein
VAEERIPPAEPVLAQRGASPANASDPRVPLDDGHWHIYEANPAPWWVALLWAAFFVFGVVYLITNLLAE